MATPFDPSPLTPAQQKQVDDRAAATAAIAAVTADIEDTKIQLSELYDAWFALSQPLPAQPPTDPKIPDRNHVAALWYSTHTQLEKLLEYRGALLGWRIGIGQPNHPPMPTLSI